MKTRHIEIAILGIIILFNTALIISLILTSIKNDYAEKIKKPEEPCQLEHYEVEIWNFCGSEKGTVTYQYFEQDPGYTSAKKYLNGDVCVTKIGV